MTYNVKQKQPQLSKLQGFTEFCVLNSIQRGQTNEFLGHFFRLYGS